MSIVRQQILQILEHPLPKPSEQLNNFILWLGNNVPSLGKLLIIDKSLVQAEIGASTNDGVDKIIDYLANKNIVEEKKFASVAGSHIERQVTLSIDGWERYEDLKRGSLSSRKVFMAMQYGDKELDNLVTNCFRPAVKDTGFDLHRLDDVPKAGLIDDRLRVEIRTSCFFNSRSNT